MPTAATSTGVPVGAIVASLCDSRTCNQSGGGEHIKADIEDFLQLLPVPASAAASANKQGTHHHHKVNFTTCLGMCNRSPNLVIKSTAGGLVLPNNNGSRLVNDGGLRMRVVEEKEDEQDDDDDNDNASNDGHPTKNANINSSAIVTTTPSSTNTKSRQQQVMVINDVSIPKLARAVGFDKMSPNLVRASDCQVQGKKWLLREKKYVKAWECFYNGRLCCEQEEQKLLKQLNEQQHEDTSDMDTTCTSQQLLRSSRQLQASLLYWSATCRLQQWEHQRVDNNGATHNNAKAEEPWHLLQSAAAGASRVLTLELQHSGYNQEQSNGDTEIEKEGIHDAVHRLIRSLVHCGAGSNTLAMPVYRQFCRSPEKDIANVNDSTQHNTQKWIEESTLRTDPSQPCTIITLKVLIQSIIVVADAWSNLASHETGNQTTPMNYSGGWKDGALIAYQGVLAVAALPAATKLRLFRVKERRRIQTAMSNLSDYGEL
jgi:hypothetical protein